MFTNEIQITDDIIDKYTQDFIIKFGAAVRGLQISSEPIIPVLFSGGVDSLMVALMAGNFAPLAKILLFNVAFGEVTD